MPSLWLPKLRGVQGHLGSSPQGSACGPSWCWGVTEHFPILVQELVYTNSFGRTRRELLPEPLVPWLVHRLQLSSVVLRQLLELLLLPFIEEPNPLSFCQIECFSQGLQNLLLRVAVWLKVHFLAPVTAHRWTQSFYPSKDTWSCLRLGYSHLGCSSLEFHSSIFS